METGNAMSLAPIRSGFDAPYRGNPPPVPLDWRSSNSMTARTELPNSVNLAVIALFISGLLSHSHPSGEYSRETY